MVFEYKCHWHLFPMDQLTTCIGSDYVPSKSVSKPRNSFFYAIMVFEYKYHCHLFSMDQLTTCIGSDNGLIPSRRQAIVMKEWWSNLRTLFLAELINLWWILHTYAQHQVSFFHMMTSSNWNIFRITVHLCGKFTGHRWIPRTKARDECFLWWVPEQTVE